MVSASSHCHETLLFFRKHSILVTISYLRFFCVSQLSLDQFGYFPRVLGEESEVRVMTLDGVALSTPSVCFALVVFFGYFGLVRFVIRMEFWI